LSIAAFDSTHGGRGAALSLRQVPRPSGHLSIATEAKSTVQLDAPEKLDGRRNGRLAGAVKRATAVVQPMPCGPVAIELGRTA
jgi:hypothetical protein